MVGDLSDGQIDEVTVQSHITRKQLGHLAHIGLEP